MERPRKSKALDKIAKRIEEDESRAYAQFVKEMQGSEDRQAPMLRFLGERFEIRAYYNSFLVTNYEAIQNWYEPYLHEVRNGIIQEAEKAVSKWRDAVAQGFREKVAADLLGRLHHWKSKAMERARQFQQPEAAKQAEPSNVRPKQTRHSREPNLELLKKAETLSRNLAAEALGVTVRTIDRWMADGKLDSVGAGSRTRLKTKDLARIFNQKS